MAENELIVTAGLDFKTSEGLIISQLNQIQDEYNKKGMQINCKISDDSLKAIQTSLGNLTQTLNVNVNAQNIQQSINQAVKSEPVKVSVEADIKKGELQKQINAFVEKFHLTFDKGESGALKAELGEILAKYDQMKKAGNSLGMEKQWDELTSFVEQYATEIDVVSEKLREATKQSKLFISESQKSDLVTALGSKGAVKDYLNSTLGWFKWTYNPNNAGTGWDKYASQLNELVQTGLYDVNANSIDDVAKINTTHIVEGLEQLNDLLHQDTRLADEWYKTYENDLEALRGMWEGLRQGVVDYLNEIRGEKQSVADMGWEDISTSESTEKVRNYTNVLKEGLEKIASLKAQIYSEGGDAIKSVTSRFTADATGNVDGFVLAIQKSNGEVENLYHKLVEVEDETGNITREWARTQITGSDSGIQKAIEQASKSADTLERRLINLKAAADDKSAPRPIKSEESISKVEAAYNKAIEAIEKLRQADKSTFAELDNEAKKAVDEFNNVVKAMRNADTAATKLRAKPIETIKAEETASLDKFVATIANSAIPNIENLTKRVDELRNELSALKTGDKQGLTNYLDNFSILEEQFKTLNTQAKITKSVLNDLGKMPQNSNVKALTNEYQALMSQIGAAKTVDDYRAISETLATLKPLFNEIIQKTNDETIAAEKTANAIKAISDAYNRITDINKKLTAGNLTSVEANYYKEDIKALEILAIEERQNLEYAGLYTDEVKKQIQAIKDKSNAIVDARNQQKASDEALSSALQIYNKELDTIKKSYSEIATKWQPKITSLNSTDTQVAIAQEHKNQLIDLIRASQQRLETEGLIDQTILDEIAHGKQLIDEAEATAKAENEKAEVKKREAEARKQEKQDLQDVNKLIKDNLTALEKFNNSTVAKNNKSYANVMGQVGINTDLITQLKAWQDSLKSDSSATNVAKVRSEINALGSSLQNAVTDSQNLNNALANTSAEATLEAKIKTLTNQMNAFALNNEKAITSLKAMKSFEGETFKSQWENMLATLGKGNLDAEGLKRLTEQFRIFKTEVQGTGQLTTSFADKMGGQLKMLASRWLSLYAVIGKIRTMINYVVELDTAMTKLKRVTDETAEGYERFLETAKKSAKETSTTLTDTVEQAARWAKSGYDAATSAELAKTSLIYSIVGDVDNETAVSDLVTVLRGFNMEAEDSLSIVDKLDALNNKYATDAKSLGEALSVSASAMASANNDLDQTLALITGASEITQNAKETGQAIRTITMRLRGRISCLHMGKLICI